MPISPKSKYTTCSCELIPFLATFTRPTCEYKAHTRTWIFRWMSRMIDLISYLFFPYKTRWICLVYEWCRTNTVVWPSCLQCVTGKKCPVFKVSVSSWFCWRRKRRKDRPSTRFCRCLRSALSATTSEGQTFASFSKTAKHSFMVWRHSTCF